MTDKDAAVLLALSKFKLVWFRFWFALESSKEALPCRRNLLYFVRHTFDTFTKTWTELNLSSRAGVQNYRQNQDLNQTRVHARYPAQ